MKKLFPAGLAAALILLLAACAKSGVLGREDILHLRTAVVADSVTAWAVGELDPELDVLYCDSAASVREALRQGSAACAVLDESQAEEMTGFFSGLSLAPEPYAQVRFVLALSEDNTLLLEKLNGSLAALRRSGELERILAGPAQDGAPVGAGGDITVAVEPDFYPLAYYDGEGRLSGTEIDLVRALCRELGLTPEFLPVERDMLLYMAQSGKCAFALGRIQPDPLEGLAYTDSYLESTQRIVVRK